MASAIDSRNSSPRPARCSSYQSRAWRRSLSAAGRIETRQFTACSMNEFVAELLAKASRSCRHVRTRQEPDRAISFLLQSGRLHATNLVPEVHIIAEKPPLFLRLSASATQP